MSGGFDWIAWVVLPGIIFSARTLDVSLATLRIVFIAQGRRALAPVIGFFESLLWLLIVGQALQHLSNPACVIAYAGGYAMGNWAGLMLEERLALGMRIVRIILQQDDGSLSERIHGAGFGVTTIDGVGRGGPVRVLFAIVRRKQVDALVALVREHSPRAVYSIEDVRQAAGTFPRPPRRSTLRRWRRALRKAK